MSYHPNAGAAAGSGAPTDAQYVTLASNTTLTVERVLTAGSGVSFTDNGAGGTLVVTNTGQPLDATLTALAGLDTTTGLVEQTGTDTFAKRALGVAAGTSIPTRADADTRYAAASHTHAQADITNLTTDLGNRAFVDPQFLTLASNATLTNERVLTAGSGISFTDNGAGGTLVITNTQAGGGAPTTSQYVTLATDAGLDNERVLTAGSGISFTDGGAGGTLIITNTGSSGAPADAQYVTLATNAGLSAERTLAVEPVMLRLADAGANGAATISTVFSACSTTADSTISATALSNVTGMSFSVSANSSYFFRFYPIWSTTTNTANGIRFAVTCPASPTRIAYTVRIPVAADGTGGEFQGWGTSSGDGVVGTGAQAAATHYLAEVFGILANGANAGTLQLQWGSELAASSNSLWANSYGFLQLLR